MSDPLYNILIHTYHPDKGLRTQAETALKEYLNTVPTALLSLISYVKNRSIDVGIRKAAVIQVKNKVKFYWDPRTEESRPIFTREQKDAFKAELLATILEESDNSIRRLLAESFGKLLDFEYPTNWPTLLRDILGFAQTENVLRMHNALVLLRQIAKRYEFKAQDCRGPLDELVSASFPALQGLMTQIIGMNTIEAAQVMKVCLKIFWSSTHYLLPTNLQGINIELWFQHMAMILQKDLPEASTGLEPLGQPVEREDREAWPWWKLKKWTIRIVVTFIQRYGNPKTCNEEYVPFAEHFKNNTAKMLLQPVMHILQSRSANGAFVTNEVHRQCLVYINSCVELSPTYKILKPNLDWLMFGVLFTSFCLTPEEMEMFTDDPADFVRKVHDPIEEWVDPRLAATNVLQMLARYRQKDTLPKMMAFIQHTLTEYAAAPMVPANYRKKDGVLVALGALSSVLRESKTYRVQVEPFFNLHVIPEFQNPIPVVRFRAFWVIEYYHGVKWKADATFHAILRGCINGLRDPSIPVRAAAACSMKMLFEEEAAHDTIRPLLKEIVAEYFKLMDEVDSTSVMCVIQSIVSEFGEELHTIAPAMVQKILQLFQEYSSEASEDNDEAAFSACECLETVCTIISAVSNSHPEVVPAMEALAVPIIAQVFATESQCYEYVEDFALIISYFTYYPDKISPAAWSLCGPLLKALDEWAFDYMLEIANSIFNFISKDINTFLSGSFEGVSFVELLFKCVQKALTHDGSYSQREGKSAAAFLTCLVSSCQDQQLPNSIIAKVLEMLLTKLGQDELNRIAEANGTAAGGSSSSGAEEPPSRLLVTNSAKTSNTGMRVKVLEGVLACIVYDAPFCLQVLMSNEAAGKLFFNTLFANLQHMDRVGSERLVVMAFASIFKSMPLSSLPPMLRENLQPMMQQMIREIKLIKEKEEAEEEEGSDEDEDEDEEDDDEMGDEDDEDEEDEDEDDDAPDADAIKAAGRLHVPEDGYGEDEDCVNVNDESYRDYLNSLSSKGADGAKHMIYRDGELMGYDDDDDDAENEQLEYVGAVERCDLVTFFVSAMQIAQQQDPASIAALQSKLQPEDIVLMQGYVAEAAATAAGAGAGAGAAAVGTGAK